MRLLHVFATFGAGGPQLRAVQLIAALGKGHRHAILAMDGDTAAAARLPADSAVDLLPPPSARGTRARLAAFARLLPQQRPDLVLTYNWGAIEAAWAARRLRLPRVHHEDGFGADEAVRRRWRRNWLRQYLLADAPVIVPSRRLYQIGRREWRLRQLHHLPNGVDLQRFAPAPAPAPAPAAAPAAACIGSVGGLRPEKDQATLLRAFAVLQHRDCSLRLCGDGPLRAPLQALAQELGIADRVQFAGAVADPAAEYRRFTLFALSSRTEQMPLSQLEAMATALPVAATDVGDVAELLPPACRGAIVPPEQPQALAAAIDGLLADPERRQREGTANRLHCEQQYELGACLSRYLDVYRQAMQPPA